NRPSRARLRQQTVLILFLARDFVLLRQHLGRLAHHHLRQRTEKSVAIHSIPLFLIAEPISPPSTVQIIRNPRHGLGPASENAVLIAQQNRLMRQRDRLHSRRANLIHRKRCNFRRHPAAHRNLPRYIRPAPPRRPRIPEDGFFHLPRLHPGPLHRSPSRGLAHVGRR